MIKQVGKQLQQARTAKEISLEQVSEELHIRIRYLKALEEGDLSVLPSAVQVRGFLRLYAEYLKLDANQLLESLQKTETPAPEASPAPEEQPAAEEDLKSAKLVSAIFEEIGYAIRQRRELLGLSAEDIEEHTRIPAHYIDYIESGQFENFPSPVQARGMLGNYVNFLEMDTNAVLLRYAEALQTGLAARQRSERRSTEQARPQREISGPSQRSRLPIWFRSIVSPDTILIGTVGIVVIVITFWGIGRITRTISETVPQPTAPALADVLIPSSTPEPSPTGTLLVTPTLQLLDIGPEETAEPSLIPTLPIAGQANIQMYIITRQRTYLKVTVDGVVEYDGRANQGINLAFTGNQTVEVLTGNAAALQIFFNEQEMGALGLLGEVVNLVFTRDGVIVPTATPTPTLSPEQLLSLTPTSADAGEPDVPEPGNTPIP